MIEVQESEIQGTSDRAPENAVLRALRENLGPLQRNAIDLEQAFEEFVTACSSMKPGTKAADALPAMLRAQAFAASLSASLSVLSNFAAMALSSEGTSAARERQVPAVSSTHTPSAHVAPGVPHVAPPLADVQPAISEPERGAPSDSAVRVPMAAAPAVAEPVVATVFEQVQEQIPDHHSSDLAGQRSNDLAGQRSNDLAGQLSSDLAGQRSNDLADHLQTVDAQAMEVEPQPAPADTQAQDSVPSESIPILAAAPHPTVFEPELPEPVQPEQVAATTTQAAFDISTLPADIQDLHRRANRVAKVAMQDIKLLRPQDVQKGRESKDLCQRLRSDLDKARKEYDRRFRAIQEHPVDYFHRWAVDILAQGDENALGEYPYPSPVLRH